LSNAGLVFAGRISYGLYIYHILVAMLVPRWLPSQLRFLITIPSLRLMVLGITTLGLAAISWRFLERPINRFRSKITQVRLGPKPVEQGPRGNDFVRWHRALVHETWFARMA
jgi:peptidoglycan/LPS O-acetylase OafA/YrhL